VLDASGQSLVYVYARETRAEADIAKVLTLDEVRRIAVNVARLICSAAWGGNPMSTSQRVSHGFQRLGLLASPAFSFVKRILAGVVLTLMLTGGAAAGPLEDGERASRTGDYATALRLWRPLAEQDDADAQNNLGLMYRNGQGVPQDYAEAVKWYRLAAEQSHSRRAGKRQHRPRTAQQLLRSSTSWSELEQKRCGA
jgi:TPR repeat protein